MLDLQPGVILYVSNTYISIHRYIFSRLFRKCNLCIGFDNMPEVIQSFYVCLKPILFGMASITIPNGQVGGEALFFKSNKPPTLVQVF